MTKAEQLRTGRSDALRKLSGRYAAAEHVTPPPPPAHDLDNEANDTARPVDCREQCQALREQANDDDHPV